MTSVDNLKQKIQVICNNYTGDNIGGWIFGNGSMPAKILFVGEAPGKTEIEQGKPFVGIAGQRFEQYLKSINISRNDVRITNACYFRPINIKINKQGRKSISNRTPKQSEINLFKDILDEEINLTNPKIIVTLGNTPLKRLTEYKSIGECHGNLIYNDNLNRYIFPMYHPSSLTYNRSEEFRISYDKDWEKLKVKLEEM